MGELLTNSQILRFSLISLKIRRSEMRLRVGVAKFSKI